jgi:dihydrofolate reductase
LRNLVYYVAITLDGFIAGPDGGDPSGTSYFPLHEDLIEFIVTEFPETLPGQARQAMGSEAPNQNFDTVLMGRSTYEAGRVANPYPHLRQLVVSTTLGQSPDSAVELVTTDPLQAARALKAEDGLDIWMAGGGKLAYALLPEIDRLIIKQNPSVIGSGIPVFDGPFQPQSFRPTDLRQLDSGIRILSFDRL